PRLARRLLPPEPRRLLAPRAARAEPLVHLALAPREEGSERRGLRAGEADRLLCGPGHADLARALREGGHRGMAAGLRVRWLPPRHRRRRGAEQGAGSRLVAG